MYTHRDCAPAINYQNCNRILVLDKGRIMEDGTYDELIAKNGFFAELVKRQRLDTGAEKE